jgi:hypothetical protein
MEKIAYWRTRPPKHPASRRQTAHDGRHKRPEAIALDALIDAHQATHGDFADTAAIAPALKSVLDVATAGLAQWQLEALDQIAVTLARICAGDFVDHWQRAMWKPSRSRAVGEVGDLDRHLDARLVLAGDLAPNEESQRLAQRQLALGGLVQEGCRADRGLPSV